MSTTEDYFNQVADLVNSRRAEIEADLVEAERLLAEAARKRDRAEQEYSEAERRVTSLRNLLTIADGEMPEPVESPPRRLKLQEAMVKVLEDAPNNCLTAYEIAAQIEERRLYRMRDGRSVEPQQIHARVGHYPNLFARVGNGAIALTED